VKLEGTQPRRSYAEVASSALAPRGRPHVPFQWSPNSPPIYALYDTGASPNCIRESIFLSLRSAGATVRRLPNDDVRLNSASSHAMDSAGTYLIRCWVMGRPAALPFVVCRTLSSPIIIGAHAAQSLGLAYNPKDHHMHFVDAVDPSPPIYIVRNAHSHSLPPGQSRLTKVVLATEESAPPPDMDFISTIQDCPVIARCKDGRAQIYLVNPTHEPVEVPRGAVLAIATRFQGERFRPARPRPPPRPLTQSVRDAIEAAVAHLPPFRANQLRQLLLEFHDVISRDKFDLGACNLLTHRIVLTEDNPVFKKQFPIPSAHMSVIREHVDNWLRSGIIEPANSPYNSPIFCVGKKDGGFRLCLDYRAINKASLPTNYCIRTVEDCLSEIGANGSTAFCALDLSSGFYHMPLHPESRPASAFTVPGLGQFQWRVGAMGLSGCPGSFARLMDMAMARLPNTITYLDDILVHARGEEATLVALRRVLQRLRLHDLRLNLPKSLFLRRDTPYLGHSLSAAGVTPGPDKCKALRALTPPTSPKQLRSFLGMVNYFRSYVPAFATRAAPLYRLTRPNSPWKGGVMPADAIAAFEAIRQSVVEATTRRFPCPRRAFHLYVDAAVGNDAHDGGLGACLMQPDASGAMAPVAFASRQLKPHEKNYSAFLLEKQAAVFAIEHFEQHLKGRHFYLYTDHKPLVRMSAMQTKTLNRLQTLLLEHSFTIRHVAGKDNPVADYLSRNVAQAEPGISAIDIPSAHLLAAQEADPLIRGALEQCRNTGASFPPWAANAGRLCLDHSRRFLCIQPADAGPEATLRVVLPRILRDKVTLSAHQSVLGGHLGAERTAARIRRDFWWPNMAADVNLLVRRCYTCQRTTNNYDARPAVPTPIPPPRQPNERVHIDLMGPLRTEAGPKYIVAVSDAFTKQLRLATVPHKSAPEVAEVIWRHWITVFGVPQVIVTDNGREFNNNLQRCLWTALGIDHRFTSPFYPRCNLQVERTNRDTAKYLRAAILDANTKVTDWERFLPALTLSLNSAVNSATGKSPHEALLGYDPRVPLWPDVSHILGRKRNSLPADAAAYLDSWATHLQHAREAVRASLQRHQALLRGRQPPDTSAFLFTANQPIWLRLQPLPPQNPKLQPKWEPATVVRQINDDAFLVQVQRPGKRGGFLRANRAHIKPREESVPPAQPPTSPRDVNIRQTSSPTPQAPLPPPGSQGSLPAAQTTLENAPAPPAAEPTPPEEMQVEQTPSRKRGQAGKAGGRVNKTVIVQAPLNEYSAPRPALGKRPAPAAAPPPPPPLDGGRVAHAPRPLPFQPPLSLGHSTLARAGCKRSAEGTPLNALAPPVSPQFFAERPRRLCRSFLPSSSRPWPPSASMAQPPPAYRSTTTRWPPLRTWPPRLTRQPAPLSSLGPRTTPPPPWTTTSMPCQSACPSRTRCSSLLARPRLPWATSSSPRLFPAATLSGPWRRLPPPWAPPPPWWESVNRTASSPTSWRSTPTCVPRTFRATTPWCRPPRSTSPTSWPSPTTSPRRYTSDFAAPCHSWAFRWSGGPTGWRAY
jgi:hypothetical protein